MENPSLGITVCHHSASLVMPTGDPRDGFFYPTLTLMIFFILALAEIGYIGFADFSNIVGMCLLFVTCQPYSVGSVIFCRYR